MNMKLDDLDFILLKHSKDEPSSPIQDLRSVNSVWTSDKRTIVEHKVPGGEASVFHDLGRRSVRFGFAGDFLGLDAKNAAEALWQKFHQGQILPFSSDIVALSGIANVVIEQLDFLDIAGEVNHFRYRMVLREHKDPQQQQSSQAPSQEEEASDNVDDETGNTVASVNYVTGKVVDADQKPVEDAKVKITGDSGEFEVTTDENGVFRKDDVDPGTYEITVDMPGYEDQKREVEVKAGEGADAGESEPGESQEESTASPAGEGKSE